MAGSKEVVSIEEAENPSIVVQIEETSCLTRSMEQRLKSVMDAEDNTIFDQSQTPNTRIRKVSLMLRHVKEFEKYFEPRVVSIGPYHHGKIKYEYAETLKLKFTKQFNKGDKLRMQCLYNSILKEIKNLRECYDEEATEKYDDEALAWMLFVDGCSVLHYIYCHRNDTLKDWRIKEHHVAFVHQDLFLLENQLPFRVLELLMNTNNGMDMIEEFIKANIQTPDRKLPRPDLKQKPSHLLELLRTRLIGPSDNYKPQSKDQRKSWCSFSSVEERKSWHSFRTVKEVTAAGIRVKPSKTNCLGEVSFQTYHITGHLKLPPIIIDDSTKPKFLNLIAYEMSPGIMSNLEVISYICFLDSLIDLADDVKQLRTAGIVHNVLGSDEQVAQLFNEIGTDLVPNPDIYSDVRVAIQKHYKDKWKSWMAQFFHDHFSSPWTIIAFIGIVFALLVSVVQTVFTVIGPLAGPCDDLCKNITKGLIKIKYNATENQFGFSS